MYTLKKEYPIGTIFSSHLFNKLTITNYTYSDQLKTILVHISLDNGERYGHYELNHFLHNIGKIWDKGERKW